MEAPARAENDLRQFRFKAVDSMNQARSGVVEAVSREIAIANLAEKGLTIVSLVSTSKRTMASTAQGPAIAWAERLRRKPSPSYREIQIVVSEWSRCLSVGLTIADAVAVSAEGRVATRLGQACEGVQTTLRRGIPLRQALHDYFPRLAAVSLSVIEAAEKSGRLAQALEQLADRLERQQRLKAEVRSALAYPAFVVVTAVTVVVILLQSVVPTLDEIIGDRREGLPATAQLVLEASRAFRAHGFGLLAGVSATGLLVLAGACHPALRPHLQRQCVRIPLLGPLLLANDAAHFARSLAAQIAGGIPMGRATDLAGQTLSLGPQRDRASKLAKKLSEGTSLSDAIASDLPDLPRELARFSRIGEQTGRLPALLEHAADTLEESTRRRVRTLTSLVTPTITVVLGALVGFVVLSLMSAIVSINTAVLQ